MANFICQIPSLYRHCISLLPLLRFPFLFHLWQTIWCRPCTLYPSVHFLCMRFNGIIAITNSNGDSASPWNMPLWIFTSVKLFPPAVISTLQFSMVFSINFMTSPDILYILKQSVFQLCGTISYAFFVVNTRHFALLEDVLINVL